MCDKQRQHPEDHEDVPLQRHTHRDRRKDPQVEAHHDERRDHRRPATVGEEQRQRHQHLDRGADVSKDPRQPTRTQIVREMLEEPAFQPLRSHHWVVGHHRRNHEWEVPVKLRCRCAHPNHQEHQLGRHDHIDAGEQERDRQRRVNLAAGREIYHLVAQAEHRQQAQERRDLPNRQNANPRVQHRYRARPVGQQAQEQHRQQRGVEQNIDGCPGGSPGEWDSTRPGRQSDRLGP